MTREILVPLVRRLNIASFTIGLILYEGGFWGGVLSLQFWPSALFSFLGAIVVGLACFALSCHLTWYK